MTIERHKNPIDQEPGRQLGPDEAEWMSDLVDTYNLWAISNDTDEYYELYQQSLAMEILGPAVESRLGLVSNETEKRNEEISRFRLTDEEYYRLLEHFHARTNEEAFCRVDPTRGTSNSLHFALASNLLAQHMYFSHPIIRLAMENPSQIKDHSTLLLASEQTKQIKRKLNHPTRLAHLVLMQSFTRRLVSSLADDEAATRTQAKNILKNILFASPKIRQTDLSSLDLVSRTIASSLLEADFDCSWFGRMNAIWNQDLRKAVSQGEKESDPRFYLQLPDKVLANLNKISKIIVDARILESSLDADQPMYPDAGTAIHNQVTQLKDALQQKRPSLVERHEIGRRDGIVLAIGHKAAGAVEFSDTGVYVGMSVEFTTKDGKQKIVDYTVRLENGDASVLVNAVHTDQLSQSTMESLIQAAAQLVEAEVTRLQKSGIQFAKAREGSPNSNQNPGITSRWRKPDNRDSNTDADASISPSETKPTYILRENLFDEIDSSRQEELRKELLRKLDNFSRRYGRTTTNKSVRGIHGKRLHNIRLKWGYRVLYEVVDGVMDVYQILPHDTYLKRVNNKR